MKTKSVRAALFKHQALCIFQAARRPGGAEVLIHPVHGSPGEEKPGGIDPRFLNGFQATALRERFA